MMRKLKLSNSPLHAIVDDEDYERCLLFKWCIAGSGKSHNIITLKNKPLTNFIMCDEISSIYDHEDRNFRNNQKSNLRLCTHSQNMMNRVKYLGTSSKFKGVSFDKFKMTWRARIKIENKSHHLGYFEHEIQAAKQYDRAAKELFGKFAVLNF